MIISSNIWFYVYSNFCSDYNAHNRLALTNTMRFTPLQKLAKIQALAEHLICQNLHHVLL